MQKIKRFVAMLIAVICASNTVYAANVDDVRNASNKAEFRAVWIATVANIDWPSKKGLTAEQQKAEFIKLMDAAESLNLNAVIVQIRPASDAFYKSELNPWSEYLTGTQGKDPGYDPLEFMIDEAHKRNLEFHAWFNPFRVSNNNDKKTWAANSIVKTHPEWIVDYDDKKFLNPGIKEANDFVVQSVMEVVNNYDIDAVQFDDYFYPYPAKNQLFKDEAAYKANNNGFKYKTDWRRDNINQFIKAVSERIKDAKPYVKLGISPFGIWRSKANDPSGADTTSTLSSYDNLYADTMLWVKNGWIDYIAPQIYWEFDNKLAAYDKILNFWVTELEKYQSVQLYIGHATYKIGTGNGSWLNSEEIPNQLNYNQSSGIVKGSLFYNMSSIIKNPLGIVERLKSGYYKNPALVPPANARNLPAPEPVVINRIENRDGKNSIEFSTDGENVSYFVIYRAEGNAAPDTNNAANILKTVRFNGTLNQIFTDGGNLKAGQTYAYAITAVNRQNVESKPSEPFAQ